MNFTTITTRMLLVPLLAVGLLAGGITTPAMSSTAGGNDCCQTTVINSACCGLSCCQAPAPLPERSATDQAKRTSDRPNDLTIASPGGFSLNRDDQQAERSARSPRVPASGSPSLITQHVRLQI